MSKIKERESQYCHTIIILFAILCFISCRKTNSSYKDISDFYYPINELQEGMVYEYRCEDPSFANEYVFLKSTQKNKNKYLFSYLYDANFKVSQFSKEKYVSNGSKLESMHFYNNDSSGIVEEIQATIEHGNFFPFQVKDSLGIFLSSVIIPKTDSTYYRVIRNKKYTNSGFYNFEDNKLETITIGIKQLAEDHDLGVLETQTSETQIYAKGIGLVVFEKYFTENFRLKYILNKRYSKDDFKKETGILISE